MRVPASLRRQWRRESEWLFTLPQLAAECAQHWGLALEEPIDTPHSLVVPAGEVVLKLNAPGHFEADHEADALAFWDGYGAVQLVEHDDERRALLLERCRPGTRLWDSDVDDIAVALPLLARLSQRIEGPHPFRLLADEAARWVEDVERRYHDSRRPFEHDLLDFALDVFRTTDPTARHLANQDLHGGNILEAQREPFLVIDPKPLVGEAELDAVGLLRNAALEGDSISRWLDSFGALGLDRMRVRGWGVAHALAWGWDEDGGWSAAMIDAARAIRAA